MNWNDLPRNPSPRTLRQFGVLGAGVCLATAASAAWSAGGLESVGARAGWWLAASLAVALVALVRPRWLRPIFVGWLIVAFPIGWVVGRVALGMMFFALFTPVGLLFRMMGRDPMERRRRPDSYWHARDRTASPADYLRQY